MAERTTPGTLPDASGEASAAGGLEVQHARLGALLQAHLLEVIGADFGKALQRFRQWHEALPHHIRIEETLLLPHVPEGARWAARVYRLEHERILLLAEEYAGRLKAVAEHPPGEDRTRREAALDLLDSAHPLRHLIEHHHEREHVALALELPAEKLRAAWAQAA